MKRRSPASVHFEMFAQQAIVMALGRLDRPGSFPACCFSAMLLPPQRPRSKGSALGFSLRTARLPPGGPLLVLARRLERHHAAFAVAVAIARPGGHQFTALIEQVAAAVGALFFLADAMRQRKRRPIAGELRGLHHPVTKRRAESMHDATIADQKRQQAM